MKSKSLALSFLAALFCLLLAAAPARANAFTDVNRALDLHHQGEYGEALKLYDRAINSGELTLDSLAMAYNNRAALMADLGQLKKAMADYAMALELSPTSPLFYTNRGLTQQRWGHYQKALDDYNRALELDDGFLNALLAKAWLLATCPVAKLRNGGEAVDLAGRAVAIKRNIHTLDTLAAALAENRKFLAAERIERQALNILEGPGGGEETEPPPGMTERLKLYAAKKPYREPPAKPPAPRKPE